MQYIDSILSVAQTKIESILGNDLVYYRKVAPTEGIPFVGVLQKKEHDKELGGIDSGIYLDSPHVFVKLSDLDFTPVLGDSIESVGWGKLEIYKILEDGEGGATLHIGDYRY